ncbi:isochorismatase-like protein [Aureococcus anophagefferens]|nr:isochorismatase-like protein [Aureococcus anophagefferens]
MNHAQAPVEFGFDEPAPFARVPEMLLSDEPWRDSPWDIGAVEHGEQPAVIGGGLSSADGMLCIEVGVERSRPRADSGGRPPRARARRRRPRGSRASTSGASRNPTPGGLARRRLLAVCGRDREAWLDYAGDAESVTRIFVGWAVARGAKLYAAAAASASRRRPGRRDGFGVYVVDERALLAATLALPRLCCVAPDALRFDLADVRTSPGVGKAVKRLSGAPKAASVVLPAVLALSAAGRRPAAPAESREDGTRVYAFADCSRRKNAQRCADGALYGAADGDERLSRGLRADEVEKIGRRAGVDPSPADQRPTTRYDVAPLREPLPKVQAVLRACRAKSIRCFHTRQGYRPDLADLSAYARRKFKRAGVTVGAAGPLGRLFVRGEPGSEIVEAARPREGEPVIDKTANDAFIGTDLDRLLRCAGVRHLVVVGNTLDCCVHSTLRHANDLGLFQHYETLLLSDCCGCVDARLKRSFVESVCLEGGLFGAVATSAHFLDALRRLDAAPPPPKETPPTTPPSARSSQMGSPIGIATKATVAGAL